MFAPRSHDAFIDLKPDEEILYRLPPMSNGPVLISAFDNFFTNGPHGTVIHSTAGAGDLELELRHSNHFSVSSPNFIRTVSEFHDDLWRLRVKRLRRNPDPSVNDPARGYRIHLLYTSQLLSLERRIPTSSFHDGFELNYNRQQYIKVRLVSNRIELSLREDFRQIYGLKKKYVIDTGRLSFNDEVAMTSLRLDIGAGPSPTGGRDTIFFVVRVDFPRVGVTLDVPLIKDPQPVLPPFHFTVRLFLEQTLNYSSTVESNLLDLLDFNVPNPEIPDVTNTINLKKFLKKKMEAGINGLQASESSGTAFGDFLKPWLVGGREEFLLLSYAPGPGEKRNASGFFEPAAGKMVVSYLGPRAKPSTVPVLQLATGDGPPKPPPDDGSIRLLNLPDEEPDPVPGGGGNGGPLPGDTSLFGGAPRRNIGALAKIDHIVILMQENRSFDQVLGYLSRDKINPNVDGLLPPDHPDHEKQVNRFRGRNFFPQKADKNDPKRFDPPTAGATAWPSFSIPGPCHETHCVLSQMEPNLEAPNIPMGSFVSNFASRLGVKDPAALGAANLRLVMDYFGPDDLPVYAALAREFGICDSWYTAHAGPTWPNRFVLLTGDLNLDEFGNVETDNPDVKTMIPLQAKTIFDILNEQGASWRVFEHGFSFLRLFRNFTYDAENIVQFDDPVRGFAAAAREGVLPQVTLIEPDYIDLPPGNDDHPPADMARGQALVNRIVRSLMASPNWAKTLFIITYDEHGGFYDHKRPPTDAPPLRGGRTKLGPRVPTFVISPLIKPGEVFKSRFDHTSIIATILRRFGGPRLPRVSPRVDAARDLREVLTSADAPLVRTEFARQSLPPVLATLSASEQSSLRSARKPVDTPDSPKEDFHWLLSAMRLTTGEAPRSNSKRVVQTKLITGQLLFYRDKRRDGTGQVANPSVIGLSDWQNFKSLFSGGNGTNYAVDQGGRLLSYRDKTQDGTGDVSNPSVISPGGWQNFKSIFSGGDGVIYAVDPNGRLLFFRDKSRHGFGDVGNPSVIGSSGWQSFKFLFSGGDGNIYAVDQSGRLLFFRDKTQNGTGQVSNPAVIGLSGWQNFKAVFPGGDGIIYAVDQSGRLLFFRDKSQDGTGQVANPSIIGLSGWQNFKSIFSGGNGNIYAVPA
jgi:phospholipase C